MATTTELLREIVANAGGDVNSLPDNLESTLLKAVAESVGGLYSDSAEDVTVSHSVRNNTMGIDVTSQIGMVFDVKHIKIGKVHLLEISGGKKIYNTTTASYQVGVTVIIPTYFSSGFELYSYKGSGIGGDEVAPSISLGTNQLTLSMSYTQANSTSQYSPDTIYQIKKVLMFIES